MEKKINFNLRNIPEEVHEALRRVSYETRVPMNALIIEACREKYVKPASPDKAS